MSENNIIGTFKLTKPIMILGKEVSELNIKEPTGKDVRECGFPFETSTQNKKSRMSFDSEVMGLYIERLCDVPAGSIDRMSTSDFMDLGLMIVNFLKGESSAA